MPASPLHPSEMRHYARLSIMAQEPFDRQLIVDFRGSHKNCSTVMVHIWRSFKEADLEVSGAILHTRQTVKKDAEGNAVLVSKVALFPKNPANMDACATLFMQFMRGRWDRPVSAYYLAQIKEEAFERFAKKRPQLG